MIPKIPLKLHDCQLHGRQSNSELLIVEGDSASKAVVRARDPLFQAVLPMQGKPLNAWKASRESVSRNELWTALIDSLGCGWGQSVDLTPLRYHQVTLLFDPDADGIHCGALTLMFFYRWIRPLLDDGRVGLIRAPLYEFATPDRSETMQAYSEPQYQKIKQQLDERGVDYQTLRYRGLASLNESVLRATCLDPVTRHRTVCRVDDAEAAIRVFVGEDALGG